MEKKITFIHAADLHLDSPFTGLSNIHDSLFQEIRQSTFKALDSLVSVAIKKKVDFVLLVGDLFDNEKQSLKAQIKLRNAFEQLQQHQIDVYLSYGNHDYIKGNIYPITYPDNVHIFSSEQVSSFIYKKNNQALAAIYGFSYENQSVKEKKILEYNKVDMDVPFHIGTLHGSIESNTEHDTYAPFLLNELVDKGFDYWALGHIHKREVLKTNPAIVYPGNTQGRNRKETGEKGCYYVELDENNQTLEFIPLQSIQYNQITIDLTECETIHQVEEVITKQLNKLHYTCPQLLDVSFHSKKTNLLEWKKTDLLDDIIEIVNETYLDQTKWCYIFRYEAQVVDTSILKQLTGEHFLGELTQKLEEFNVSEHLNDVYQHKEARKYLKALTNEEKKIIKQEAYELLLHELAESR